MMVHFSEWAAENRSIPSLVAPRSEQLLPLEACHFFLRGISFINEIIPAHKLPLEGVICVVATFYYLEVNYAEEAGEGKVG